MLLRDYNHMYPGYVPFSEGAPDWLFPVVVRGQQFVSHGLPESIGGRLVELAENLLAAVYDEEQEREEGYQEYESEILMSEREIFDV